MTTTLNSEMAALIAFVVSRGPKVAGGKEGATGRSAIVVGETHGR